MICPCCLYEYGLGMDDRFLEYRAQWILAGFPFRVQNKIDWNKSVLIKQLAQVQKIAKHYYFSSYSSEKKAEDLAKINAIATNIIDKYWKDTTNKTQ